MVTHPHLIFPRPEQIPVPSGGGGGGKIKTPTPQEQGERLLPKLDHLAKALEEQRLALKDTLLGQEPHEVLVVETRGPPQNLVKAARKIGLGWLAEEKLEEKMPPEHGFEAEDHPSKKLSGHIYFALTNRTALDQLRNLFVQWKENPKIKFPRGTSKLKSLFAHIHEIRYWSAKDRLWNSSFAKDLKEKGKHEEGGCPFEAELWFARDLGKHQEIERTFTRAVKSYGGAITGKYVLPDISYHGVLGKVPAQAFADMDDLSQHPLFQCVSIRFFDAVAKCSVPSQEDSPSMQPHDLRTSTLPSLPPVVALMDGVPLQNHRHLKGRIKIIDPGNLQSGSEPATRRHGTAMASLICHGDLNLDEEPIRQTLCVLPILKSRHGPDGPVEEIPNDRLVVDRVHQAVLHLRKSEPTVRVVNLSVCDPQRPFAREIGPWARLLDWLSYTQDVLFIVSAGNCRVSLSQELGSLLPLSRSLQAADRAIAYLTKNSADRRLLAPAETTNGLTVGAIQADGSSFNYQLTNAVDPFDNMRFPGVYSAHGPGYRKAVKPDIFLPGGRQLYEDFAGEFRVWKNRLVGQKFASPGKISGKSDNTRIEVGTSNAAALASRSACLLHETLGLLRTQNSGAPSPEHDTVLMKALLVHGSGRQHFDLHKKIFEDIGRKSLSKEQLGYYLGYGELDTSTVQSSTDKRVTAMGFGALKSKEAHSFSFPLPQTIVTPELSPRLIVTLAWLTPINSENQEYRIAKLWFDIPGMASGNLSRMRTDQHMARRGTVQHEIFQIQKSVHLGEIEAVDIHVCCREGAGKIREPIRYGLVVTFEIDPEANIEIYQEIKDRLEVTVGA